MILQDGCLRERDSARSGKGPLAAVTWPYRPLFPLLLSY